MYCSLQVSPPGHVINIESLSHWEVGLGPQGASDIKSAWGHIVQRYGTDSPKSWGH
jgi:hypothetical protein